MASHTRWMMIRRLTIAMMALSLFACDGNYSSNGGAASTTSTGSPNPTGTILPSTNNGGVVCGGSSFCVNVVPPPDTTMVLHQDGSYSTPCNVTAGSDTACILEADELDLYFQGLTLNYNVPTGMCYYMQMQPYFYYQYPPGIGPSEVTITIDSTTGVPSITSTQGGTLTTVTLNGTTPTCSADYSSAGGPNCCAGDYSLVTITQGVPSTSSGTWGGNPNDCLVGPAVDSQTHKAGVAGDSENGVPQPSLYTLNGQSLNKNYVIAAPNSKGFTSNAYIANFWQSGVTGDYPLTTTTATGSPLAMQGPNVPVGTIPSCAIGGFCTGNPWYEFECLDPAMDIVARIHVLVRSWSSDTNFKTYVANQTNLPANGTYNLWGAEPNFPDQPIEDYETWVTPDSPTLGVGNAGCKNTATPLGNKCGFGNIYPTTYN